MRPPGARQTLLFGRDAQLDTLLTSVKRAQQSSGSIVLVSGEAGIGKTRLCQEVLAEANQLAMHTLLGRAYPEDTGIELGPVVDSFRAARRGPETNVWLGAASRSRLLWTILPELAVGADKARTPATRSLLFETLLDIVAEAAGNAGMVWLLEDLHWADTTSWEFVFYAARRIATMRLMVLVTLREEELPLEQPWTHRLGTWRREGNVIPMRLLPLSQADTEHMVRAIVVPGMSRDVVMRMVARSEGIPLLVEELVALHDETEDSHRTVPEVVRATVRQGSRQLDAPAREMLEVAAVLGPQLDIDLLLQLRPETGTRSIQQLIGAGLLIMNSATQPEQMSFRHALVQEAAYADIPWATRRDLHCTIAEALISQLTPSVERAARHWEAAGQPARALDVLVASANHMRANGNVGRAASLGLAALAMAEKYPQVVAQLPELRLVVLGDLFRAGRWTEVTPLARAAWAQLEPGAGQSRAWLANLLGLSLFYSGAADETATFVTREVARLNESEDRQHAALLLSTAAFIALFNGDTDAALRQSEKALELAVGSGDLEAEHRARNVRIMAHQRRDHNREAAATAHRLNGEVARAAGLTVAEANSWWNYAHMTAQMEDYAVAERAAEQAGTWYATVARLMRGLIHLLEGRPSETERLFSEVRAEIRHGIPMMAGVMDASDAHLMLHRGHLDAARKALTQDSKGQTMESNLPQWAAVREAAHGWLAWEEADMRTAERAFQRSQHFCAAVGYHAFELGPIFIALHVDALCRLDERERAASVIEEAVAVHRMPDRFLSASLAAARFRLCPSSERADAARTAAESARWPWSEALRSCWCGELLDDARAASASRDQFAPVGATTGGERVAAVALEVYGLLRCSGFARVDLMLEGESDSLQVLELNPIPGLTETSLLPQATCAADERCVPCFNPVATDPMAPTGACTLGCDKPIGRSQKFVPRPELLQ